VREEKTLLHWAQGNQPDLVLYEPKLQWADLKAKLKVSEGKAVTEDGEIVPGVTVLERGPLFYTKGEGK
jgi:hypothetical protein